MPPRRSIAAALTCLSIGLAAPAVAQADKSQEAMFQDDNLLIFNSVQGTNETLDRLAALGVDRVRISVFWGTVAPASDSQERPADFNANDPGAYPPGNWARYDFLVQAAQARGMDVNFNVTSPAPKWATPNPAREDIDETFEPRTDEFASFVRALGTRYSGTYSPTPEGSPLPRVDFWSIWNEPNQPGWLTPQWRSDPREGRSRSFVEAAPAIYRGLVSAAWNALQQTGHRQDTILIGDLAPKGLRDNKGQTRAVDALRFLRGMYCLDANAQFYRGSTATARGCPAEMDPAQFVAENPGLFEASGFAHHPYELLAAPDDEPRSRDWVTIANLHDLQSSLRRIYARYRVPLPSSDGVPIWITEFGYQTDPPDPTGVSPKTQAEYINWSEYIAFNKPYVRSFAQFLLVDGGEPIGTTFQSGLMTLGDRREKPAYDAYRVGLHIPDQRLDRGDKVTVFGILRPETRGEVRSEIQFRTRSYAGSRTSYRKRAIATSGMPAHYLRRQFAARLDGWVRIKWTDATGTEHLSRSQYIEVDDGRGRD